METLLLVAERDGPEMLARIAVMKALNRQSRPIRLFDDHGALLGARFKKREQSSNCTKFISLKQGNRMTAAYSRKPREFSSLNNRVSRSWRRRQGG